jgi:hypothetical protein
MVDQNNSFKQALGHKWIKAPSSGLTYLCPAEAVQGMENPSEGYLQAMCVDESANPQNS